MIKPSRFGKSRVLTQSMYSYRGYYSRKYEHDFYARKTYLNHVMTKNEEVRKKLSEY